MKLKRRSFLMAGVILIIIFMITLSPGCSADEATQDNSPSSAPPPTLIQNPSATATTPVSTFFPEPSKPAPYPSSAKWNPYAGQWYDSSAVSLDPVTHRYIGLPPTVPPESAVPHNDSITGEDWIAQHRNSTDEIDIALIHYYEEMDKYIEIQRKNNPYWMASSVPDYGAGEGGPLTILTDLGIPNLQKLVDRVQPDNPTCRNLQVAIDKICHVRSTKIGFIDRWKKDFNDHASNAKSAVENVRKMANSQANEQAIDDILTHLGIFSIPEFYELVIEQGDSSLIKYLPEVLPLDKMKSYHIQKDITDEATLKQALASCQSDIAIIKTLHAD